MAALKRAYFLDSNVLVHGTIELADVHVAAQRVLAAAIAGELGVTRTAWHCCLEFFAVSTRIPIEFRLSPAQALRVVEEDFLAHLEIHDLDASRRASFLREVHAQRTVGGGIYDAHIAEIAAATSRSTMVTENGRHFAALTRRGVRVLTCADVVAEVGL